MLDTKRLKHLPFSARTFYIETSKGFRGYRIESSQSHSRQAATILEKMFSELHFDFAFYIVL